MRRGIGIASIIVVVLIIAGYFGYQHYDEQRLRSERISSLMKYANTTDYNSALLFDDKYSHMAMVDSYNQSVLEFFSYWLVNRSLAETCLEILGSIEDANKYLSRLNSYATSCFSKDNLTLVLSVFTDRDEYLLSTGEVNFTVIILSNKDLGYVNVTIFGFKSRYRGYVVNNKWIYPTGVLIIPVARGFNSRSFNIDIPCSPCYGVESGPNTLTCVIKYNGLNLNATKIFLLK